MMNIDKEIMQALSKEDQKLMATIGFDDGLEDMVVHAFKSKMRGWMIYAVVMSFLIFGVTVWTGLEFVNAETVDDRLFWGLWTILGFISIAMFKIWTWMEMSRTSVLREIKRMEIALLHAAKSGPKSSTEFGPDSSVGDKE